ncbi:hypothetical protein HBB16_11075 [Pseudonocardia sp. MCCB 268]|nr:hypothetical protein [Pseudonocardia cytotoxica]
MSTGLELLGTGMPEGSADRATVDIAARRDDLRADRPLVEGLRCSGPGRRAGLKLPGGGRPSTIAEGPSGSACRARRAVAVRVTTELVRVVGDRG